MSRRDRPDHFSQQARREGYVARSVYKLEELQKRFRLLRAGDRVLDVGAAPGSWSQYARKIIGRDGGITAVDLQPLPDLEGFPSVTTIEADVFDEETVDRIAALGPYNLVMSDAAPSTTGNRTVDTARSAALVEQVVTICERVLVPGGAMVAKIFQGGDEQALLAMVRARFESSRLVKPKASRSESFETFLVGLKFQGVNH